MMKKFLAPVFPTAIVLLLCLTLLPAEVQAADEVGFAYEVLSDGTIHISGIVGKLQEGQDLVIPDTIDGKPVTRISGDYGFPYRSMEDLFDYQPYYGSVTLPSTECSLVDASFIGFSGTLVIPENVNIDGGFVAPTISELVFEGYRELPADYFRNRSNAFTYCETLRLPEGTVSLDLGNNIFSHIYLPSTFRAFAGYTYPGSGMTFYLYKHQREQIEQECSTYDECEHHLHSFGDAWFYYLDEGIIPMEQITLDLSNQQQRIFAGWECEVAIKTQPINANEKYTIELSSDNEAVASVSGNQITANKMGTANITVRVNDFVETFGIQVYGISIISESNNVKADGMEGSFDLGNNASNGAVLKFLAEKIETKSWDDLQKIQSLVTDFLKMDMAFQNVYDLSVQFIHDGNTTAVQPKEGKLIRIRIPMEQVSLTDGSRLMHIADDGTVSELQFTRVKQDGKEYIQFDTPHFSTFAFVDEADPCANGHTEVIDKAVNATCLADGLSEGKHCSVCDTVLVKQEPVSATGHEWNSGRITQEASCAQAGKKTYTCLSCGETKSEDIPKLTEHAWNKGVATKEPTCKDKGTKTYTCLDCNQTKTEDIPKLTSHVWNSGTQNTDGTISYSCAVCGEVRTDGTATESPTTVPATAPSQTTAPVVTTAPITAPPETTTPAETTTAPTEPVEPPEPPSSPAPVIIAVVSVIAICGAAAYLWFFQKELLLKIVKKLSKK